MKAREFLQAGIRDMEDKAKLRDQAQGERSMGPAVTAFWAMHGRQIITRGYMTETDGWRFMLTLKQSRSANGEYHENDYVDLASYAGLAGEAAARGDRPEAATLTDAERAELLELREWRKGKKGIEEYYALADQRAQLAVRVAQLEKRLQELAEAEEATNA